MPAEPSRAVFLSYASQDAEPVRGIAEALRAAGVEVWFDENELVGGDAWDQKIRRQIKDCALFVPVISAATQARTEGYFRLEWRLADQRTHLMAKGRPFLLPIVIDETRDADAHVPDSFLDVQWTRLPAGETPEKFCARVSKLLGGEGSAVGPVDLASVALAKGADRAPLQSNPAKRAPWLLPAMIGAVGVVALAIWQPWHGKNESTGLPAATVAPARPISEARQQMERARSILDNTARSRANYEAAEEIMRRALALDATDAEVWAMAARVDANFYLIYDRSAARREQLLQRSAKAIALAPKEWEPRQARAWAFTVASDGDSAMLLEAENLYRQLLIERPDDARANGGLAEAMKQSGQFQQAAELFERSGNLRSAGWAYVSAQQYGAARALADREIAKAPTAGMLKLKIYVEAFGFEDLDAAQAASNRLTAADLMDDENVAEAVRLAVLRRDAGEILRLMKAFPGEKIDSVIFRGSKHIYIGAAYSLLSGRTEAARSEWRVALQQTEAQLKISASDPATLRAAADLHALLGDKEAATSLLRQARSLAGFEPDTVTLATVQTEITLGHVEEAMARMVRPTREPSPSGHAWARYHFRFDPLRGDPRFEKFLRDTLPPGAKPFADDAPATGLMPGAKP